MYLLIFSGFLYDEVHLYNSLDELLFDWDCDDLKQFKKEYYHYVIYEIKRKVA